MMPFKKAKLKLTTWYLLIIMSITLSFSGLIYFSVMTAAEKAIHYRQTRMLKELSHRDTNFKPLAPEIQKNIDSEALDSLSNRLIFVLGVVNAVILAVSGALGYFLAGKTLKPIEYMMRKQREFMANAAHELRTPLAAMTTEIEVTLRSKNLVLEEAVEVLNSVLHEVRRLSLLSNSIMQENRTSSISPDNFEKVSMTHILNLSIEKVDGLAKKKKINIFTEISDTSVKGEEKSLVELFTILIDNSIKYSYESGEVRIESNQKSNNVVTTIEDNGIGISEKDQAHIFDRFYRVDKSRSKSNEEGFGLGLSIAKNIVDSHNGKIELESELEKARSSLLLCRQTS